MRFWDSSGIVPLLVEESTSATMQQLVAQDRRFVVWWATSVEVSSALHRRFRTGELTRDALDAAQRRLARLANWAETIPPGESLRDRAHRLLAVHPLRAADALQLAAALAWAQERPTNLELVTLDDRLRDAAAREGFRVLPCGARR